MQKKDQCTQIRPQSNDVALRVTDTKPKLFEEDLRKRLKAVVCLGRPKSVKEDLGANQDEHTRDEIPSHSTNLKLRTL